MHPFLYLGTCQAYQEFGDITFANLVKGLLAVRKALEEVIITEFNNNNRLILEGAFLDPKLLREFGTLTLLTVMDEKVHKRQFLSHREKVIGNEFKAARLIQEYLIQEASDLGVEVIDNNGFL